MGRLQENPLFHDLPKLREHHRENPRTPDVPSTLQNHRMKEARVALHYWQKNDDYTFENIRRFTKSSGEYATVDLAIGGLFVVLIDHSGHTGEKEVKI